MAQERRILPQTISEVNATVTDDGVDHIRGKGIVFNEPSLNLGGFREYIDTGSLDGAVIDEMKSYYNHDGNYTLGTIRNKTVDLEVTSTAAFYDILAPTGPIIKELVLDPIKRGDVTGSSFMFDIPDKSDYWEKGSDGMYTRYVRKISYLYEMGPVSMPAYTQTSTEVAKRSLDQFIKDFQEKVAIETHFRRMNAQRRLKYYI